MRQLVFWLGLVAMTVLAWGIDAPPASAADAVVLASGALQRCLGITPGQARFAGMTAATAQYCQQLPGAALYDQAGQRYQAGDRPGAAKLATSAAQAGNPLAQLRLAIMYEGADGVPRDTKAAFDWYRRAASVGEPAAQMELGGYYEAGTVIAENWDLAAKLYQASATQGWHKGQFASGARTSSVLAFHRTANRPSHGSPRRAPRAMGRARTSPAGCATRSTTSVSATRPSMIW